jgi:hypothetical protein
LLPCFRSLCFCNKIEESIEGNQSSCKHFLLLMIKVVFSSLRDVDWSLFWISSSQRQDISFLIHFFLRKGSCTWGEVHLQVFVSSPISFPPFVSPWFCLYSRFPGFCFSNLVNLVEATCFIFVCSCFLELRSTELLMPLSQLVEAKVLCYIVQSQP